MIVEPKEIKFVRTDTGQTIGVTSGCWDLLHFYHLHYFNRCASFCDVLMVGVDADDLVLTNKGKMPAIPEYHRVQMVAALRCVDVAFIMRNMDDLELASQSADYIFKNSAVIYGEDVIGTADAELRIIPDVQYHQSTSEIKKSIYENTDN